MSSADRERLARSLGILPAHLPKYGVCRGVGCSEKLDIKLIDRPDGTGLHALCTELIEPAKLGQPGPTEADAVALLKDTLGAEVIVAREPDGPCKNAHCAKDGQPCGFDVAAHINKHGIASLRTSAPKTAPEPATVPPPAVAPAPGPIFHAPVDPCICHKAPGMIEGPNRHCPVHGECCGGWISPEGASVLCEGCPSPSGFGPAPVVFHAPVPVEPEPSTAPRFAAPAGTHPLKAEMIKIIRWANDTAPRSQQREIGMSEVGVDCLRRLAYSLDGTPKANRAADPWFAIVGTSVHTWLAGALERWSASDEYGGPAFQIEQRVTASDGTTAVSGSTDFYRNGLVGDHKIQGPDKIKKLRDGGMPSNQYRAQLHLNGLGWEQAGWPVDEVALLVYPRSGYLDGMHVWSEPYSRDHALQSLARLASVRALGTALGAANVPASPDMAGCVWCPFYRPGAPADATGCPGK